MLLHASALPVSTDKENENENEEDISTMAWPLVDPVFNFLFIQTS